MGEAPFGTLDYDAITKSVYGLGESDAGRRTLVSVDVRVRGAPRSARVDREL